MSTAAAPNLSTILKAMNNVDNARTREQLINDAVNLDESKVALCAKLKATYAEQKLEVSDEALDEGVSEFFDARLRFTPMEKGLNSVLARLYIARNQIAKGWAFAAVLFGLLFAIVSGTNAAIHAHRESVKQEQIAQAKAAVVKAEKDRIAAVRAEEQRAAQAAADESRRKAHLAELPTIIESFGQTVLNVAKEPDVITRANSLILAGVGAAKAGDLSTAEQQLQELRAVLAQLNAEYELRINLSGRKGGSDWVTGGWRDFRGGGRRYYIVVNAVRNGAPVNVPVTSEETGETQTVSSWAEQVSESTFAAIRQEKSTRGSLANTLFGRKAKGYMNPEYLLGLKANAGTANAAAYRITRW